jgi:hypothetical protein
MAVTKSQPHNDGNCVGRGSGAGMGVTKSQPHNDGAERVTQSDGQRSPNRSAGGTDLGRTLYC